MVARAKLEPEFLIYVGPEGSPVASAHLLRPMQHCPSTYIHAARVYPRLYPVGCTKCNAARGMQDASLSLGVRGTLYYENYNQSFIQHWPGQSKLGNV